MQRKAFGVGVLISSLAWAGCSGAPPAGADGTTPQGTDPLSVAGDNGSPMSPVGEPAGVVGVVRLKGIGQTLQAVSSTAGLPAGLLESGKGAILKELTREVLRGQADTRQFAEVIAFDAPVDAIVALDADSKRKNANAAVAIGLTSLEGAKAAAEAKAPLTEIATGMWRMGGKERFEPTCAIAESTGPTPARLICGPRDADLIQLGPYLARTITTQPAPTQDIVGEIRIRPLDERFGGDLRKLLPSAGMLAKSEFGTGNAQFDAAMQKGAKGLADEAGLLISDLDKVRFGLTLNAEGVSASGTLMMRGQTSWIATGLANSAAAAGAPPAHFWQLPKDSDSAFFTIGSDPSRYKTMEAVGRDLIEGAMAQTGVGTEADAKALSKLLRFPMKSTTMSVQASGDVTPPAPTGKNAQKDFDAMVAGIAGWHVIGFNEGPAEIVSWLDDAAAAYNRPAYQAFFKKEMGSDATMLPRVTAKPAPAGLGAGSKAYELSMRGLESPMDDKAKVNLSLWLYVMPDGDNTWIALGSQTDELVKRLKSVKSSTPKDQTLASRDGLSALKSAKLATGGFVTVGSFTGSIDSTLGTMMGSKVGKDAPPEVEQLRRLMGSLPNKGETPILITGAVASGDGISTTGTINVPQAAIKDIVSLVMGLAQMNL